MLLKIGQHMTKRINDLIHPGDSYNQEVFDNLHRKQQPLVLNKFHSIIFYLNESKAKNVKILSQSFAR